MYRNIYKGTEGTHGRGTHAPGAHVVSTFGTLYIYIFLDSNGLWALDAASWRLRIRNTVYKPP